MVMGMLMYDYNDEDNNEFIILMRMTMMMAMRWQ